MSVDPTDRETVQLTEHEGATVLVETIRAVIDYTRRLDQPIASLTLARIIAEEIRQEGRFVPHPVDLPTALPIDREDQPHGA